MSDPQWAILKFPEINYQDIYYYSAPKGFENKPKDLSEVDPKLIETYNKLALNYLKFVQAKMSQILEQHVWQSFSYQFEFI